MFWRHWVHSVLIGSLTFFSLQFLQETTGLENSVVRAQEGAATTNVETTDGNSKPAHNQEALPKTFAELVKLKGQRIAEFREANQAGPTEDAISKLTQVVRVESALLDLAETELGESNIKLANQYRQTVQDDGALLASMLMDANQFEEAAETYRMILLVARRRSDLTLETFNDLVALTERAERLASASTEDLERYKEALLDEAEAAKIAEAMRYEKAANLLKQSIDAQLEIAGSTPHLAGEMSRCAMWLKQSEKLEESEAYYRKSLAAFEKAVGRETVRYASTLYNLAVLLEGQDRVDEAIELLHQTRMIENRIGIDLNSQLVTLNELAGLYKKTQQAEKFDEIVGAYRYIEARSRLGLEAICPYLPIDAYVAISISPAAMMQSRDLQFLPHEVISTFFVENLGVNPRSIEQIVAFLTLPFDEQEPNWGILIKTVANQPLQIAIPGEPSTIESNGSKCEQYTLRGREIACIAQLTDGIFVVGNQEGIEQVLGVAKSAGQQQRRFGKLANGLLRMHGQGELLVSSDFEKIQVLLQAMVEQIPELPPSLENLKKLPVRLDSVTASVSISKSPYVQLRLTPREDASAESIQKALAESMQTATQMLLQQASGFADQEAPAIGQSLQQYLTRIINEKMSALMPTIENGQVVMKMDQPIELQAPMLVGLLLPAVQAARDAAQRMEASNNLRQIGLALWNYHDVHGHFPTRAIELPDGQEGLSWRVQVLPFLEQQELYEKFHLDEPWNSEHNLQLVNEMPEIFAGDGFSLEPGKTNLVTLNGEETMMPGNKSVPLSTVTDGVSNTCFVVEADPSLAVIWTQPVDLPFDMENPTRGLFGARKGGVNVLMADGAIRFLSGDTPADVLKAMATRAGGEVYTE